MMKKMKMMKERNGRELLKYLLNKEFSLPFFLPRTQTTFMS